MAKYPIVFQKGDTIYQRSADISQMELLFILSTQMIIRKNKRKSGEITFAFNTGEFVSSATAKRLPLWVLKRFAPESKWK